MNTGIIDSNRFGPYGEPLDPFAKNARLTNSPFGFTGEAHDIEARLVYLRARYYEPGTMQFLQQDTYWNPNNMIYGDVQHLAGQVRMPDILAIRQSTNLYAYGANNPVNYIDPSGNLAYPGQIHNLVVNYVAFKHGFYKEQTINYRLGWGRADLISDSGEVWDVKRDKPAQIAKGQAQVLKYTLNVWKNRPTKKLTVGGFIEPGSFVVKINVDTYYVSYRYAGKGVIAYDYYKTTDWKAVSNAVISVVVIAGVTYIIVQTGGAAAPALAPLLIK